MDTPEYTTKHCTKCGKEYPTNAEFFHRNKLRKDGLNCWCKPCQREYDHQYYLRNHEHRTRQKIRHYQDNREQYVERNRQYYLMNREQLIERNRLRRLIDPEKPATRDRQYHLRNPHISCAARHRRRALKRALPADWTAQDWLVCLDYWNRACAVCGHQLRDLFGNVEPHREHWIALTDPRPDNPGTVPGNMLPLCSLCNLSKNNKDAEQWLIQRFGKRKATIILKRIHAYFEWVKRT